MKTFEAELADWLLNELIPMAEREGKSIESIPPEDFRELVAMVWLGKLRKAAQ